MTKVYKQEIQLSEEKAKFYNTFCGLTGEESTALGEHYDNVYCEEVEFPNGYKAIIELVIADYDNPNTVTGVLINPEGYVVQECYSEYGDDNMLGEWFFWTGEPDAHYHVIIK